MSEWRPTDWEGWVDAIEPANCTKTETEYYHFLDGVEAGADAIVAALRKQDICDFRTLVPWIDGGQSGTLVYIPGEKDG